MTMAGFKVYDGVPVADLSDDNMVILGHYDKITALKALDRHSREALGWADLHAGREPGSTHPQPCMALMLDSCQVDGYDLNETCPMCRLVAAETMSLLLVDEYRIGAFPVMIWAP